MNDSEILALILGSGQARENAVEFAGRILRELGGLERLSLVGLGGLCDIRGMGEAKACRVLAAVELGMRVAERGQAQVGSRGFCCSADIFDAYRARLSALPQEIFLVLGLNNKNQVVREEVVAKGVLGECLVGPREVFRPMIAEAAARVALVHNHPSGDPAPSPQDVALTERLVKVGELVGIPVVDHVVVGRGRFASFRDLGLVV